jgi:hypothetical protein
MEESEFYEWFYNLELQTLTDELKHDIMDKVQDLIITIKNDGKSRTN